MPTFACPYCGKAFQAAATSERVAVSCPHCTQPFEITDPAARSTPPQAAAPTLPPVPPAAPAYSSASFRQAIPPAAGFTCPLCQSHGLPLTKQRVSIGGWVTLVVLAITCLPFFWIGFLIKEDYQCCRTCGKSLS